MKKSRRVFSAMLFALVLPLAARAQYHSSITFSNGSGDDAVVKLVGPSARTVDVPNGTNRAAGELAPGQYYIVVRYGAAGRYSYSKGNPFEVQEYGGSYSEISITLHKVVNGNYSTRPAGKDEFESAH